MHCICFKEGCHFTQSDIEALEYQCNEESFKGLDILMTSCWPKGVSQFANQPVSVLIKEHLLVQQLMSFFNSLV